MTIAIVTIIVLVSLAVLAYPFVAGRSERDRAEQAASDLAQRLRRSRDRVYEGIRVLQQEYFLANMTEEEYRERLREARLEAARLLQQQQQVQQTLGAIGAAVEAELSEAAAEADRQEEKAPGDGERTP